MSIKKSVFMGIIAVGIASISYAALAADTLIIENKTNMDSTSRMNGAKCSTELLGEQGGVTKHGDTKKINIISLRMACAPKYAECRAEVFVHKPGTKAYCSGQSIATVYVNADSFHDIRILRIEGPTQGYSIEKVDDSHVIFSGGPSATK
jgi:hypothetical protein